jgi:hypothetical protein
MQAMGDLKRVAAEIDRRLESGELGASSASSAPTPAAITNDWLTRASRLPASERLTVAQRRRRVHVMRMIERYRFDMKLEPFSEQMLKEEARSYDQQLSYAGATTDRLHVIYLEAIASYPEGRLLNAVDFVRAWRRLQKSATERFDTRPMGERGDDCSMCHGTGTVKKYKPYDVKNPLAGGEDVEAACPYRCKSAIAVRKVGLHAVA